MPIQTRRSSAGESGARLTDAKFRMARKAVAAIAARTTKLQPTFRRVRVDVANEGLVLKGGLPRIVLSRLLNYNRGSKSQSVLLRRTKVCLVPP
ncbi:hypothetical protein GCM10022276_23400 [Sphingomonas limnosediminicola]|uniref:Uncharacterized protein n=1 Tax=Sphingomonas limnosediminicola TaxID=940133 RepID=A0ABP7LL46_9SPHN